MSVVPVTQSSFDELVNQLAERLNESWRNHEPLLIEHFFVQYPELTTNVEAVLELLAEELALREEYHRPITVTELQNRFPDWSAQVRALWQCHRLLGPRFPAPQEDLGDFQLHRELGRGTQGRAYLATQRSLADRPVVLKMSPETDGEHLSLARLQHTNIVPLYSIHDFSERGLRAMCMPYFGGATLADILSNLPPKATGRDLLPKKTGEEVTRSPAWAFLERSTFSDAVCWLGACLADALQYAHDRELLHLDLKPSNILIAADGVPMLLDFHLSQPPIPAGGPAPRWLGGTPGYMAPEQHLALSAVRHGKVISETVDGRADVYALGILLREMLHRAKCEPSPGLSDVLERAVAPTPQIRYETALSLASDLRRHLSDLPLKGVSNRSMFEQWQKWRRRRPYALPLLLTMGALLMITWGVYLNLGRMGLRAHDKWQEGKDLLALGKYVEALESSRTGEMLVEGMPFQHELRGKLQSIRLYADRAILAKELHQLHEQAEYLSFANTSVSSIKQKLNTICADIWDRRQDFVDRLKGQPTPLLEEQWHDDLIDIAILLSESYHHLSNTAKANEVLTEAEDLLGKNRRLQWQRARLHGLPLNMDGQASTLRDHLDRGRALLISHEPARALIEMDQALLLDRKAFWPNCYRGIVCLRLKQPIEAIASFSACIAIAPDSPWCYYNRGLAFADAGLADAALQDYDTALSLDPRLVAAWLARAGLHQKAGRTAEAISDLSECLRRDPGQPDVRDRLHKLIITNTKGSPDEAK